ncbi:MAG: 1-acyl-sn-glycerol-3-phosphate acyltransferase [Pelotomaculum sp.]|uniref:1-acyl-sn-glycerol-3-phosphate acyltransferase n=1 Tax=Pelotomaculum thermopropionicum (strain DSM 13744 / JCM 10971 / SI) TaxID=370438 RepID=A5D1R7_PELTS|nr:1-acyl-sn-glycerol-3-phosphate acyltransferase [Pelotomaculum sp.]BAF59799.1 1-acyl-sn-glycerol-3-phosphate acyltransferase [Pelotomaculum thermopropionicum SI]
MFYRFSRLLCRIILALLRRWQVRGAENMPSSGGMVVVSNHISYWDPVVVGCAFDRQIYFMAKSELFDIPLLGPVIRALGAFPVRRDRSDRKAIRTAIRLLEEGNIIGIFPEGTRSYTGEILPPHMGAAMLAFKAGVPILPVAVSGTRGIFGKVRVKVGKPFYCQTGTKAGKTELEKASKEVMSRIAALLDDIMRGNS